MLRSRLICLFIPCFLAFATCPARAQAAVTRQPPQQRVIVIMFDGFGMSYYRSTELPNLQKIARQGLFKEVRGMMPSVTNCNNASICCGTYADAHGITGNSFLDTLSGREEYMESGDLVLAPTLFEKAKVQGVRSALFSSKKKTIALLSRGTDMALTPEDADSLWIRMLGTPPDIYSPEVNYWLMEAALHTIESDPGAGCIYIHTTDYPMHHWAPESAESREHLKRMDAYIGRLMKAAPDAAILITADHDVNHKSLCLDLQKALSANGYAIKLAISAERDKYVKHHRGFGGASYVYLADQQDSGRIKAELLKLKGVEKVLTRREAALQFHLMPGRIGDLMVLGDRNTVFGDLDSASEALPPEYRTHGSLHETAVPLFIYNARNAPGKSYFRYNMDLTAWLYRASRGR